jgi:hypothetical protein
LDCQLHKEYTQVLQSLSCFSVPCREEIREDFARKVLPSMRDNFDVMSYFEMLITIDLKCLRIELILRLVKLLLLSFQLKCSSNIDSIHYLGLTNSYEFKFLFTSCAFPIGQSVLKRNLIGSFKSNRKLINFLSNELVSPR